MKSKDPNELKNIEAEFWKGPSEFGTKKLNSSEVYHQYWDKFLLNQSIKNLKLETKSVINVGGGHGKEAEFLIENGAKTVMLIDIAPKQLKSAQIRKKQRALDNLEIELGDAENLRFSDKQFDIGFIFMALHHFPSHYKSISEISRVSDELIFIDIMDAGITKFFNFLGLYKEEECGIEPNRLKENEIKDILYDKNMKMDIEYYFIPPYSGNKTLSVTILNFIVRVLNYLVKLRIFALFFGNIAIIKAVPLKSVNSYI